MQESVQRQESNNSLNVGQQVNQKKNIRKQRRNLRVRFANEAENSVSTTLNLEEYSIQELHSCWWTDSEQEGARLNAKYIASVAKKSPMLRKMETTFLQIRDAAFGPTLIHDYLIKPPQGLLNHLTKWSSTAHSVRGLERWASVEMRKSRSMEAFIARDVVLSLYHNDCICDVELAERYAEEALTSVMFARFVGEADRIAAAAELEKPLKSETTQALHVQQDHTISKYDLNVPAARETRGDLVSGNESPRRIIRALTDARISCAPSEVDDAHNGPPNQLLKCSEASEKLNDQDVFKFDASDILKSREKSPSNIKKPTVKVNVPLLSEKRVRSPAA